MRLCDDAEMTKTLSIAGGVRTAPIVLEPFTDLPGSSGANIAMLKSGGGRAGFVRDRQAE